MAEGGPRQAERGCRSAAATPTVVANGLARPAAAGGRSTHLTYSGCSDYLLAAITYLATNRAWWARSAEEMAEELSLDQARLQQVFDGFPGIFRRSRNTTRDGAHFYGLQMRYAQRPDGDTAVIDRKMKIDPLTTHQTRMLLDFVMDAAQAERSKQHILVSNWATCAAATIAAIAAILAAVFSA